MNPLISQLTLADIQAAQQLVELAGWNQLPADWQRMISAEPAGCFKASIDGQLVGTVTTIAHGQSVAWIGMMLVHPDMRRQGIGKLLMQTAIAYLRSRQVQYIGLDATPAGRPLYEQLGFHVAATWERWRREANIAEVPLSQTPDSGVPTPQLPPAARRLDQMACGFDRWDYLQRLGEVSTCVICDQGSFGMARAGRLASYLGPVVVEHATEAATLVHTLLATNGEAVLWDVPPHNAAARALASSLQFSPVRTLYRMWLAAAGPAGQPTSIYAISDPATG